jgi:hypothetical protein
MLREGGADNGYINLGMCIKIREENLSWSFLWQATVLLNQNFVFFIVTVDIIETMLKF